MKLYPHVAVIGPTQVRKRLSERGDETLPRRIALVASGAPQSARQGETVSPLLAANPDDVAGHHRGAEAVRPRG
jgi:hypothetical protein